jgi:hypothetical protein
LRRDLEVILATMHRLSGSAWRQRVEEMQES